MSYKFGFVWTYLTSTELISLTVVTDWRNLENQFCLNCKTVISKKNLKSEIAWTCNHTWRRNVENCSKEIKFDYNEKSYSTRACF